MCRGHGFRVNQPGHHLLIVFTFYSSIVPSEVHYLFFYYFVVGCIQLNHNQNVSDINKMVYVDIV